jgi:5-formyltetrahydrofolate cyclo-ligase
MAPAQRRETAAAILGVVVGSAAWDAARTVLAYASTGSEVATEGLLEAVIRAGKVLVLPRVVGAGSLGLHRVDDPGRLRPGFHGILEPAADDPPVVPTEVDLALVPGVGFDRLGHRIGYGGGYYDRLLPQLAGRCVVWGLAFDCQVVEVLPREPHDQRLAGVVSEAGLLTF